MPGGGKCVGMLGLSLQDQDTLIVIIIIYGVPRLVFL